MAYAIAQDMVDAFGWAEIAALTDIGEPRLGDINHVVLERALASAAALLDGYLVGRFALPLADPPGALRVHCQGVARYLLMTNAPDERAKQDFAAATQYLQRVASGAVALMPPSVPSQAATGLGAVAFVGGEKVFARGAD